MKQEIKEIEINGKIYVEKGSECEVIEFTGEQTLGSLFIGKKVICRSRNEGINAGVVEMADQTGVILKDVMRLRNHRPKDSSKCWYEGVSISGLHPDSKVSPITKRKLICEDYSLTECTDEAYDSIMEKQCENS